MGFVGAATLDRTIYTGIGVIQGVTLVALASTATCTVYDNTSAAGSVLAKLQAAANSTDNVEFPDGVDFNIGVHANLTGLNAEVYVAFK